MVLFTVLISLCTFASELAEFVAGEVVVKFDPGTSFDNNIKKAAAKGEVRSEELTAHVIALSRKLDFPLSFQRLTSGNELVIGLSAQQVLEKFAFDIMRLDGVERAEVHMDTTNNPFNRRDEVFISLEPSNDVFLAWQESEKSGTDFDINNFIDSMESFACSPLIGRILVDGRIAVAMDFYSMTRDLAQKLNDLDEVEYAHPNFIMRPQK